MEFDERLRIQLTGDLQIQHLLNGMGQDLERIENMLARSNDLYHIIGDCGDDYRS